MMEKEKAYAKAIKKYERKWVAVVGGKVVVAGGTLAEVKSLVERKHLKNYVFHLVPPSSVSLAPSFVL